MSDEKNSQQDKKSRRPIPPQGAKRLTPEQAYLRAIAQNQKAIAYLRDK